MKKTDIAMIVLIAGIGILVAYMVASSLPFLRVPREGVKVKTVREISADVQQPDERIFHSNAINPTVEVFVGQGANQ